MKARTLRPMEPLAVSFPCGPARQYRVQTLATDGWQMYASYRRRDTAEACLQRLDSIGITARMVSYRTCPTAG